MFPRKMKVLCVLGVGIVSKLAYREDSYLTELQPDIKKKKKITPENLNLIKMED